MRTRKFATFSGNKSQEIAMINLESRYIHRPITIYNTS